jgi:hypothetical protein
LEIEANQLSNRSLDEAQLPSYAEEAVAPPDEPTIISLQSLVKGDPTKSFDTLRESIEELDPKAIQPITSIPDYVEPASCTNPIVVKTPSSIYCLENWSLVRQALEAGQPMITCHIYHVAEVSGAELAIRKVAIRVVPQGGMDTYAERIRNVRILFNMLIQTLQNPLVYTHGGVRKGSSFTSNREDNVRIVLAERLQKSPTTISKYLNHAEYMSEEDLDTLARARAGKEFFEKAQVVKRRIINDLIDSDTPKEEITTIVSKAMVQMHLDPNEIENQKMALFRGEMGIDPINDAPPATQKNEVEKETSQFNHWTGAEAEFEATPTEEEIRRQGEQIAERMRARFQNQDLTLTALKQGVIQDLGDLASLISLIKEEQ